MDTMFRKPLASKLGNASLTCLPFSQTSSTTWMITTFGVLINPAPPSLHILLFFISQMIRAECNTTSLSLSSSPSGRRRSGELKHALSGFRSFCIIAEHRMVYRSTLCRSVALSQLKRQQHTKRYIEYCVECSGRDEWSLLMV